MEQARPKTPWHLWAIGIVALLWNSGGAYDYLMTQTRNMDYLSMAADNAGIPVQVILDYFGSYPVWVEAGWAFGVWGAVAGSLLLLLRSRFAFHAFVVSLLGIAVTTVYTLTADLPAELQTAFNLVFSLLIIVATAALAFYAKAMTARGVLR